jgi:DeoR family transcriptional regulator, aga operon transcriptional repressor
MRSARERNGREHRSHHRAGDKAAIMDESKSDGEMPGEMRREQMLAFVQASDFVRVSDLSARFGVSEVTVRGDLDALAKRGQIRRIRGGAMPHDLLHQERPFEEMQGARVNEKIMIGRTAASLVSHGETVILDVGTTTAAVARALVQRKDLYDVVIFTNALNIALALEPAIPRLSVVVIGGTLRPMQHSLVDPLGGLMLERINAHTVFLGCNGIDPHGGVTNINLPEAAIKRRMLQAARRRIIVADGSKVGARELAYLCSIDEIDLLITDSSADPAALNALRERDLEVMVAQ